MKDKEMNFEEAMDNLNKIAAELENGNLDLEQSVAKFEEGMKLSKKCNELLENAEKRITKLIIEDGETKEEDFVPNNND